MRSAIGGALILLVSCVAAGAHAHGPASSVVRISAEDDGALWVASRGPRGLAAPTLPGCAAEAGPAAVLEGGSTTTWLRWRCPDGPAPTLRLDPDAGSVVLHVGAEPARLVDAAAGLVPLRGSEPSPARDVLLAFAARGAAHVLDGADHVLFLMGLLLLVRGRAALLAALSAFTLGHSATLAVGALGGPTPAAAPLEAVIALSLVLVAVEGLALRGREGRWSRHPAALACVFGLAHGFGFAAGLSEAGLPPGGAGWALCGFNVGVELAQIGIVAALWLAAGLLPWSTDRARVVAASAVGGGGLAWLVLALARLGE